MGADGMAVVAERFGVYLMLLDPTVGHEISKTRPCVVISPDELNRQLRTVIIAPMTTVKHAYPTRVPCRFGGRAGEVVLDQIRTIDKARLVKRLGTLDSKAAANSLKVLQELFA
jgi:mRNA interferase MazF